MHDDCWGFIDFTMLSNEMIVTTSWKTIIIYKKLNSSYKIDQKMYNSNWGEVTKIKELDKTNFAVCGYYGFMIFKKNNNIYDITTEISNYLTLKEARIFDFMEIKGKENSFILCGKKQIYIINDNKIINKSSCGKNEFKNKLCHNNYICQFSDELYIVSGVSFITLVNTNENTFKKIYFFKEYKINENNKENEDPCPCIYKYNINSIITLVKNNICFIYIINNENIQINLHIKLDDNSIHYIKFIDEEKVIYFRNCGGSGEICKLIFSNKLNNI